jgi:hypothetical protein
LWKNELEAIAMPMLGSYESVLCETPPGSVFIDMKEIPDGSAAPAL